MKYTLYGLAKGADGQQMEVSLSELPTKPSIDDREEFERTIFNTFPEFFEVDPVHVEIHVKGPDA